MHRWWTALVVLLLGGPLSHLMSAIGGGQASADVQELPDAATNGQEPHHPGQKSPVRPRTGHNLRAQPDHFLARCPVGLVMIFAA